MKATITSNDFNRIVLATKGFTSKNPSRPLYQYIRLEFSAAGSCVTAVAVDGYRMSVEHADCWCDEDFVTYVRPDIKLPKAQGASIEVTEEETLIRCGDIITGCPRVKEEDTFDWQAAIPGEPTSRIGFNPKYLLDALTAAKASCGADFLKAPVILEFRGPVGAMTLRTGEENIKMVLPVRIKD